jgi:hypothetical protein
MLFPIVISFIALLSLIIAYPFAEHVWLRRFISTCPFLLLAFLLYPWSLPETFSIQWQPNTIFSDPILFRTSPLAISFSVYFCVLWILSEMARWFLTKPSISSRIFSLFFLAAGFSCFFASNALAMLLAWTILDVLTFFLLLYVDLSSAEHPSGPSDLLSKSFGLFILNIFSNILILYPALSGPQSTQLEWSAVWSNPPTDVALLGFFIGAFMRLFIFPMLVASSRFHTSYPYVDLFLRLLYPTTVLSLLSRAWPGSLIQPTSSPFHNALFWFSAILMLVSGLISLFSSSPRAVRDLFPIWIASFAVFSSLQAPQSGIIFQAAAALLLIGGGIIWLMPASSDSLFPSLAMLAPLLLCITGLMSSPGEPFLSSVSEMFPDTPLYFLIPIILGMLSMVAAIIRIPFISKDLDLSRPSSSRVFFILCVLIASGFLWYPGFHSSKDVSSLFLLLPILVLLLGTLTFYFVQDILLFRYPFLRQLDSLFSLSWVSSLLTNAFIAIRLFFQNIEAALNGEGAFFWALGIVLLAWIAFRSP